ncbi:hypothetical protein ACQJBY_071504 [Aegilops geniculata]
MECARARNVTVKHENDEDSSRQPRVLDIDGECARQLQKELDKEYVIEEASRQANRLKSMITPGVVVCVVDTDGSKDAEFKEWSDHEHDWLVEIDRRLKEQEDKDAELAKKRQEEAERESKEQQVKDEELASKCQQEIEQKAMEQLANDDQVACMYQKMYDPNATDEQIRVATTHHGQGTGAGGHRASDVGVHMRLDDFFHCRTGLGRQRTTEGRRCVIRKKRKCSKKSRKGRAKQRGSQILFRRSVQQKALNQTTATQMTGTLLPHIELPTSRRNTMPVRCGWVATDVGRVAAPAAEVANVSVVNNPEHSTGPVTPGVAMQAEALEVPQTIGTLHRHDDRCGYTFQRTTSELCLRFGFCSNWRSSMPPKAMLVTRNRLNSLNVRITSTTCLTDIRDVGAGPQPVASFSAESSLFMVLGICRLASPVSPSQLSSSDMLGLQHDQRN